MATFNGKHENLKFKCGDCSSERVIDPFKEEDMKVIMNWLQTHSASGGEYESVLIKKEEVLGDIKNAFEWMNEGHQVSRVGYYGNTLYFVSKDDREVKLTQEDLNAKDWYILKRNFVSQKDTINYEADE
jgi:hypothetical protein